MSEKNESIIKQVLRLLVESKDLTPDEQFRVLTAIKKG